MSQQAASINTGAVKIARSRGQFEDAAIRFSRNKIALGAFIALALVVLAGILAPWISPYDPLIMDTANARQAPSWAHPFGTDDIGRDVLSRMIWGIRYTLPVGLIPVMLAATIGSVLGLTAGYTGGWTDTIIMRFIDTLMAFPGLLLAVSIVAVLGTGLQNLMIAVGVFSLPLYTRLVRGLTLPMKQSLFVEAATSLGAGPARIMAQHIFPNIVASLIVLMTLGTATAILAASSLSFLGLGAQPPDPEWGSMLSQSRRFLRVAWWMSVFPGLGITFVVLSMNIIGDALRDVLDPRLRR